MLADAHRNRRPPADLFLARRLPGQLAGALVEGGHKGTGLAPMILKHDHVLAVQERRTGHAVHGVHLAEALVPDLLALEIDTEETIVAEVGVNALAIGRRSAGRIAVLSLRRFGL